MPWKEESVMCQRLKMIEQMLLPGTKISDLCERFGISRKTAYKWLSRYEEEGMAGLEDMSREPHNQPQKSTKAFEDIVINTHKEYPYWGPRKLRDYLLHIEKLQPVPSHTTLGRILKRSGYKVITSHKSSPATSRFEREEPNELWQMDFKGSFMTDKNRCHPLTILDDCSRYSIELHACKNEQEGTVKERLIEVFKDYGLPKQINVDNGAPWGCSGLNSVTSLKIWLYKLGVYVSYSAPYHPQTNGKDERFHRTLKLEVLHDRKYKSCQDIQYTFDSWQHIYNFKRPHEALNGKTPGSRYHVSPKKLPDKLPQPEYPSDAIVRKTKEKDGSFSFKGGVYYAGQALGGEYIEIRETDKTDEFAVFFMDQFIRKCKIGATI